MFNKTLGWHAFVRLKHYTHAQYHQIIGSRKKSVKSCIHVIQSLHETKKTAEEKLFLERDSRQMRFTHSFILPSSPYFEVTYLPQDICMCVVYH